MTTVIVSGALANKPGNGGEAWVRLSWVRGLARLGYRVIFVEQLDGARAADPATANLASVAYFREVVARFGLAGTSALIDGDGATIVGLSYPELHDYAAEAALLVNISGNLRHPPLLRAIRRRAYIDIDPGFTQFWHAAGARLGLEHHDEHFTIGANIGALDCPIPLGGLRWRPIRQPVVLDDWPFAAGGDPELLTTVGSWRGPFGPITHGGKTYGLKVHEFRKLLQLPAHIPQRCELALAIEPADAPDRERLLAAGWRLVDPARAAADPLAFQRYVARSGAEISAAQGIYVDTRCGWFSDRTLRYLASGRPALVQDTGFARYLPVGEGLLPFDSLEGAIDGARRIARDYRQHCLAARIIAAEFFDADKILGQFMDMLNIFP